jgi:nucleoside-diphosphate-sugar epimerase
LPEALILGCGFTGSRVAERLKERHGFVVRCTHRAQLDFSLPGWRQKLRPVLAPLILHSVPLLGNGLDQEVLEELETQRIVYLSTTSVYGKVRDVDERTAPLADHPRVQLERAIQARYPSSLILRPAAIYGPGRGIHVSMKAGRFRFLGDGSNYVSRIHVDDLAAIAEAALLSDLTGVYPVADCHPCPSREIAEFCSRLMNVPMPLPASREELPASRQADRRVDGTAICRLLGISLRYPSYRSGIPASLTEQTDALDPAPAPQAP